MHILREKIIWSISALQWTCSEIRSLSLCTAKKIWIQQFRIWLKCHHMTYVWNVNHATRNGQKLIFEAWLTRGDHFPHFHNLIGKVGQLVGNRNIIHTYTHTIKTKCCHKKYFSPTNRFKCFITHIHMCFWVAQTLCPKVFLGQHFCLYVCSCETAWVTAHCPKLKSALRQIWSEYLKVASLTASRILWELTCVSLG